MSLIRFTTGLATFLIAACAISTVAKAENGIRNAPVWPTKPIKFLVGFPGGSTPDMSARTLAEPLSKLLGQPVVVENRPGASGNIAADLVAKAADDHTFGVVINGNLTSAKMLNPKLAFDPSTDFSFISLLTTAPLILVTNADKPAGAEFFAAAKAAGNTWNYGSVGAGTVAHLGIEWLKARAPGLDAVHVPYAGNPQVVTAMIGGQVQMALIPPGVAMPQVRSGKLKAVGVTGGRSPLVPELPSLADAGITGYNLEVWTALVGPANLPKAVQDKLSAAVVRILREEETRQRLFNQGWRAVGTSPEGLRIRVKDEGAQLGAIIRSRGITVE